MGLLKDLFTAGKAAMTAAPPESDVRTPPGPLGLSLGRAVTFDTVGHRLAEKDLGSGAPVDRILITGHGTVDLGNGDVMHRYYDDQSNILQIVCNGGVDNVVEAMLLKPWDSVVPATAAEWRTWEAPGGKIGGRTYDAEGILFERVWGESNTAWIPPVEFTESITTDEGVTRQIYQRTMSYRRMAGDIPETLILIIEQNVTGASFTQPTAATDRSISFMLGYNLSTSDIRPV